MPLYNRINPILRLNKKSSVIRALRALPRMIPIRLKGPIKVVANHFFF